MLYCCFLDPSPRAIIPPSALLSSFNYYVECFYILVVLVRIFVNSTYPRHLLIPKESPQSIQASSTIFFIFDIIQCCFIQCSILFSFLFVFYHLQLVVCSNFLESLLWEFVFFWAGGHLLTFESLHQK